MRAATAGYSTGQVHEKYHPADHIPVKKFAGYISRAGNCAEKNMYQRTFQISDN
jgi:hypothetical protein